ncbi:MAG: DNA (cytosine-5-)-methyltransferase [Rhodocyclaceae bacterium]
MKKKTGTRPKARNRHIKIVDLFAGPGGLGEGFSSHDAFRIAVSAEMESSAHSTLRLRAFYRILKRRGADATAPYFELCNGSAKPPKDEEPLHQWDSRTKKAWSDACKEARQLTLGEPASNRELNAAIKTHGIGPKTPWVLIGGPPCQAYSLVGRSRNMGKANYKTENDHRHFLYKEYLQIIADYKPHVFVMENVKGILSSKVGGQQIFHSILRDLAGAGYRIHSLVAPTRFTKADDPATVDAKDFIVRAEQYGVPQARHRVILLGVREDLCKLKGVGWRPPILEQAVSVSVAEAIGDLPKLRSKISKGEDSAEKWQKLVKTHAISLAGEARKSSGLEGLAKQLSEVAEAKKMPKTLGNSPMQYQLPNKCPEALKAWYAGNDSARTLGVILNHESRGHMSSDLRRYVFAAAFAKAKQRSPKGHEEFSLQGLAPKHENWKSGKFSDRFRVQLANQPATTVTSHIAKDGHYFIHYDAEQCRSLTVREAARLQTFPDNYYFQGTRTQQYHQVGNAVPPFLAYKIAICIEKIFRRQSRGLRRTS